MTAAYRTSTARDTVTHLLALGAFVVLLLPTHVSAAMYKCPDGHGGVILTNEACLGAPGERLPDPTSPPPQTQRAAPAPAAASRPAWDATCLDVFVLHGFKTLSPCRFFDTFHQNYRACGRPVEVLNESRPNC